MSAVVLLIAGAVLLLSVVLPPPPLAVKQAGYVCLGLLWAGVLTFLGGAVLLALAIAGSLPGPQVADPGMALAGTALILWLLMFWVAGARGREDGGEDGGGGGGGGPPLNPDPPPLPPDPEGIDWDRLDRERRRWELERRPVPIQL